MTTLLYYSKYPDQDIGSCITSKLGPGVVLRTYYYMPTLFAEICFALQAQLYTVYKWQPTLTV